MTKIITVGLDLAENVFQVHEADGNGRAVLRKKLRRAQVLEFFGQLPPCVVAMEACGGAHFWGGEIGKLGHYVRLIPPAYVKPFVKLCLPQHNLNYHQVPIMRRNVRRSANFRRFGPKILHIILKCIGPDEQAQLPVSKDFFRSSAFSCKPLQQFRPK